jgi:hypothetical protein
MFNNRSIVIHHSTNTMVVGKCLGSFPVPCTNDTDDSLGFINTRIDQSPGRDFRGAQGTESNHQRYPFCCSFCCSFLRGPDDSREPERFISF